MLFRSAIVDWRDPDDIARVKGGERDDYIKAGLLRLPTNQNFRDVEELLDVKGMTPEVYRLVSPYLTTMGSAQVNLNTAPVPVLPAGRLTTWISPPYMPIAHV